MKKSANTSPTGTARDNLPRHDELSDWEGFKGVLSRGYQQAIPNPAIPLDRFIRKLENGKK